MQPTQKQVEQFAALNHENNAAGSILVIITKDGNLSVQTNPGHPFILHLTDIIINGLGKYAEPVSTTEYMVKKPNSPN